MLQLQLALLLQSTNSDFRPRLESSLFKNNFYNKGTCLESKSQNCLFLGLTHVTAIDTSLLFG